MKRCSICAHKLDEQGHCTNEKCPAYIKAKIDEQTNESEQQT